MFRAFRHANFRRFLFAQTFAMTGHWVQQIALGWLVYRLTDSALYLGLAAIPLLLAFALVQGLIQGFDWTNRQSMLAQLVDDRADLPNAIALNSTFFNICRILGPSLASLGLLLADEAACFLLAASGEAVALLFTRRLRLAARPPATSRPAFLAELRHGFTYAWHEPAIRRTLARTALFSACILPYVTLLPVFATRVFGGGPELLGLLNAAPAVGAVLGGLVLASRKDQSGLERRIFLAGLLASAAAVGLALSPALAFALPVLVLLGAGQISLMASMNTRLQTVVRDDLRGRVMSLFNMSFMAALPLGQLLFGAAADRFGVTRVVLAGAALAILGNLWLERARLVPSAPRELPAA
jgi:predicted MFS family arabinose efflux permease